MAFASMFLVFIFIIFIVLGIMFLAGLIMLIIGLVNSKKVKKVWPIVLDVLGIAGMVPLVVSVVGLGALFAWSQYNDEHMLEKYDSVPEAWMNESMVNEQKAAEQAINAFVTAAGNGDRDEFVENFSAVTRDRDDFDENVDAFLDAFPEGLTFDGLSRWRVASLGNENGGRTRAADATYRGKFDGEWYYIRIKYCYSGGDSDENMIGVYYLGLLDLAGQANSVYGDNEYHRDSDLVYLYTYMPEDIDARMIDNYPELWQETDGPVLTADEMRDVLSNYDTLREAIDEGPLGEPNWNPVHDGSVSNEYYYELQSVDGEPRYAFIRTRGEYGPVISAYEYSETDGDYDNPIVAHVNPSQAD